MKKAIAIFIFIFIICGPELSFSKDDFVGKKYDEALREAAKELGKQKLQELKRQLQELKRNKQDSERVIILMKFLEIEEQLKSIGNDLFQIATVSPDSNQISSLNSDFRTRQLGFNYHHT